MKLILLDNCTKQALHVLRVVASKMGWTVDVFSPDKPLCAYSKYVNRIYVSPSPLNRINYYIELRKLIFNNLYDAFLSFDDDITSILSENEDELSNYFELRRMLPPRRSILIADSKNRALEFAKRLGIPTPEFFIPKNDHELIELHKKIQYPVVVKGEKGAGAWKVRYANNFNELQKYYLEILGLESDYHGMPSIQEYIEGEGHLFHVLCHDGKTVRVCDHIKKIQYPPIGGVTAVGETVYDKVIINYALKICKALQWTGLSKFDFIKDKKDGEFKFIEIDPRVSASIIIPQIAGTEMIESFCRIVEGKHVEPNLSFKSGLKYRLILPREFQYLLRNPTYAFRFMGGFFAKNTYSDMCLSDIKPTLRNIRETLYAVKEEFIFKGGKYKTVSSQIVNKSGI